MKKLHFVVMGLWCLVALSQQGWTQNLIADGSFTTTSVITPFNTSTEPLGIWCSWHTDATSINPQVVAGMCQYNIYSAGIQSWEVQLAQWGFALEANYSYLLSFDVKADAPRSFGVFIGESGGNWTNFNPYYQQQAGTNWQTISIPINVPKIYALHKLSFEMGGSATAMYFDNVVLVKTGPMPIPSIEIIGSSVPPYDWSAGVDLQTTDGVIYTLSGFTMPKGEAKFRQDKNWGTNWGASSFPKGTAVSNGPNIPVAAGTYDITFNRNTGEYYFYCPSCPPVVGIVGSAVPPYDWMTDVALQTEDGVHYSISNVNLLYGELKFRQDFGWGINWGGPNFPEGFATLNGQNIPVIGGNYNIQFNRLTGEYKFSLYMPSIGILGSALNGWMDDINMETTDGVNYMLYNQHFSQGEVKFRQDDSWMVNWGNYTFPYGQAYSNGPNIPVPEGYYDVWFNRISGYYSFQLRCSNIIIHCPPDKTVPTDPTSCGAYVTYEQPTLESNCGNPYIFMISGLPSGAYFPIGTTTITYLAYNQSGQYAVCSFTITVEDKTAPVIGELTTTFENNRIWPANHEMVEGKVYYEAWDNCGSVTTSISITSNEPENGNGDGDKWPDWNVMSQYLFELRAERSGGGGGRTYTVTVTAVDAAGNVATKSVDITVPHDASVTKTDAKTRASATPNLMATITPNPSEHFFQLHLKSAQQSTIRIRVTDMTGRVIQALESPSNKTIHLGGDWIPGIYMIEIQQGDQRIHKKVIRQ